MFGRPLASDSGPAAVARPVLELSGPALTNSLELLAAASEAQGGIERLVDAVKLKAALFADTLGDGKAATLGEGDFKTLCAFMSSVRRRVGASLSEQGYGKFGRAVAELMEGAADSTTADYRVQRFCAVFPQDRRHRWVRDLAGELLHSCHPEIYPLMNRWVWDVQTNTGALREIWHGENLDHVVIDVSDGYETFLVLREELSQFLSDNGIFRDVLYYIDLLLAQVYAGYISSQGSTYLRSDFSRDADPLEYTSRLLGLDGIKSEAGRTRLKPIDGEAHVLDEQKYLNRD